jgi:CubicO group peptidase (beta-lactamase class C family)
MITLPTTLDATIDHFRHLPLKFSPGTEVEYGNSGYLVATRIIQIVSGRGYDEFLRERIFDIAGMKDTGYDHPESILKARADGYVKDNGTVKNASYIDMSLPSGAGALYSTADDLLRYVTALASYKILSQPLLDQAMSNQNSDYGYGWEVSTRSGEHMVSHIGDINGFGAFLAYFPQREIFVVDLTNMEGTPAKDIALALADVALTK